jgi:ergothioneine biosynthesis protein EgtB
MSRSHPGASPARQGLLQRYQAVRAHTCELTRGLSPEDQCVQSMPDASPVKWHLAHTTWFFEAVVLQPLAAGYRVCDERYAFLFNSYYESLGPRHPRPQRGMLTRPSIEAVIRYRDHVDEAVARFATDAPDDAWELAAPLLLLGTHHEQQHQELILTDLKHLLWLNPLRPAYLADPPRSAPAPAPSTASGWVGFAGGEVRIGHAGAGFAFDNESPRHSVLLRRFELATRLVTCGEYLEFIEDGGYRRPELWLSDGWTTCRANDWHAPQYWEYVDGERPQVFTLFGMRAMDPGEPVCHLSLYEAAAYAEWARARLPTEFEWEAAAREAGDEAPATGEPWMPHPRCQASEGDARLHQLSGSVWQWTRSSYDPYPGFRPQAGAVGEYNGKFMVGQLVLRGGSCCTPAGHLRYTYRNFFPPAARWQFSGLRLARDA